MTRGIVLDASALLAALLGEAGGEAVLAVVASGEPLLLSAVNLAEAIAILHRQRGLVAAEARDELLTLGLEVVPFDAEQAAMAGALEPVLRGRGISLGDRACLGLAQGRGLPVLTADRIWTSLDLGIDIRLIR